MPDISLRPSINHLHRNGIYPFKMYKFFKITPFNAEWNEEINGSQHSCMLANVKSTLPNTNLTSFQLLDPIFFHFTHIINGLDHSPTLKEEAHHLWLSFHCCEMQRGVSNLRKKFYYWHHNANALHPFAKCIPTLGLNSRETIFLRTKIR